MQDVAKKIIEIITKNFPNGIRDDFIDTNKVSRIFAATYNEKISRDLAAEVIRCNGTENGGRFYFVDDRVAEEVKRLVEEILATCAIAYHAAVHERHADFFTRRNIFSPDVLKKILREVDGDYFCFDEFCAAKRTTRLDYEVAKIFAAAGKSLSRDELQEKFPYVPTEKILAVLSNAKKYLPTSAGNYIPASAVQFDTDEIAAAKQKIFSAIAAKGFAAPEDYDLTANFALNPELAEKTLRNLIYEKFFACNFTRRAKKLFKSGDDAKRDSSTMSRLRNFVAAHDELPAAELFAFADSLNTAPSVALSAAHEQMIRVEKNLFVKDALINFDVAGVDDALSPFVQGKIISLRAVNSFTGFPSVAGYSWNLFMLESFLRKFSRRYAYAAPAVNSANIGAIHPKTKKFADYLDLQAAVVVQENITLEPSAVEDFLVGQGFRERRKTKTTERIITRAQEISRR